jgi:hypothetical protein
MFSNGTLPVLANIHCSLVILPYSELDSGYLLLPVVVAYLSMTVVAMRAVYVTYLTVYDQWTRNYSFAFTASTTSPY